MKAVEGMNAKLNESVAKLETQLARMADSLKANNREADCEGRQSSD